MNWERANEIESNYWGIFTAELMTLKHQELYIDALNIRSDYFDVIDNSLNFSDKKILDVGGGPASLLLRTNNTKGNCHDGIIEGVIIDPVIITEHQLDRYKYFNLNFINDKGENIDLYYNDKNHFDETIIYNCLQHVENPIEILDKITHISKRIRLSEPINASTDEAHLHEFTSKYFDDYFINFNKIKCEVIVIGSAKHYTIIADKKIIE